MLLEGLWRLLLSRNEDLTLEQSVYVFVKLSPEPFPRARPPSFPTDHLAAPMLRCARVPNKG